MNVIIIVVDALRPDALSPYGGRLQTPNIESFAKDAVLFERHFTHVATTLPSHTSLFTSLYPHEHGVLQNGTIVSERIPTLAGQLKNVGYQTAGFISAAVLHRDYGINKGFDHWDDNMESRHNVNDVAGPKILSDEVTERAVEWLSSYDETQPFFMFIHYFDPHTPENIPEPWLSMYPRPAYLFERILYHKLGYRKISPYKILAQRNTWYDGAVTYTDLWIGHLLGYLKDQNLYDETLILITADHGEANGDHAWTEHNVFMYDEFVHIPLLMKLPNKHQAGHIVTGLTEHIDLMPTILDAIGQGAEGLSLSGTSWWKQLITGQDTGKTHVFGQRQYYDVGYQFTDLHHRTHTVNGPMYFVRSDRYKFIAEESGRQELFDLLTDKNELHNIATQRLDTVQEMSNILRHWKEKHPARYTSDFHDEEITIQRLRDLGYLD